MRFNFQYIYLRLQESSTKSKLSTREIEHANNSRIVQSSQSSWQNGNDCSASELPAGLWAIPHSSVHHQRVSQWSGVRIICLHQGPIYLVYRSLVYTQVYFQLVNVWEPGISLRKKLEILGTRNPDQKVKMKENQLWLHILDSFHPSKWWLHLPRYWDRLSYSDFRLVLSRLIQADNMDWHLSEEAPLKIFSLDKSFWDFSDTCITRKVNLVVRQYKFFHFYFK